MKIEVFSSSISRLRQGSGLVYSKHLKVENLSKKIIVPSENVFDLIWCLQCFDQYNIATRTSRIFYL